MSTWFDAAIQRASSLSLGPASMGRRNSSHNFTQQVASFKKMVNDLKKDESPSKCIDFFLTNFANKTDKQLTALNINIEVTKVIRHIQSNFELILNDKTLLENVFYFLNSSMRIYYSSAKSDAAVFNIFHRIIQTNDENVIAAASCFVRICTKNANLLNYFFSGEQLVILWSLCYIESPIAFMYYAPLFNEASLTFTPKDGESVELFTEKVLDDFNDGLVVPQNFSVSTFFAASVVCKVNTGNFLIDLLPLITDLAPSGENMAFFEPLLKAKTSKPDEVWKTLYSILEQNDINITLLESALQAIKNTKIIPDPRIFSYSMFIPRFIELSEDSQKLLFELLKQSNDETKADFLCFVMPLSQTGISTEMLSNMIEGATFNKDIEELLDRFIIEQDKDEVDICLSSDKYFCNIVEKLVCQMPSTSPRIEQLFSIFFEVYEQGEDQEDNPVTNIIRTLLKNANPKNYMQSIFETLKLDISEKWLKLLTEISQKVEIFNEIFFEMNGAEFVSNIVETKTGLDFLASLAVDGPYESLDEYLFKHFKETKLPTYGDKALINLMMGIPQDSALIGFLRIPSLCAFVQNVPLRTPYDRYIYSLLATKYFTPSKEQIIQFAVRFMNSDLAIKICRDPEYLSILTDPLFPHSIVFQMHPMARNCFIQMKRTNCCSIWFYIAEMFGKTALITVPGGTVEINTNGYIFFGGHSANCTLNQWHLFSFATSEKDGHRIITGYFDAQKIAEIVTTDVHVITIGNSDSDKCQSIWFVSPFLHPSEVPLSQPQIQQIYDQGPLAPTQRLMKETKGVKLVPYRGILRYMHLFGGPHFVFNLMLKTNNKEDFMFYMQSAFNLYHLSAFELKDFYASVHYVLRSRLDLFSKQIEQILLRELTTDNGFNWEGLFSIMGDVFIISSPYVSCQFLINTIQTNKKLNDKAVIFFHLLLDAFVFIKCDVKTIENILTISKIFIKYNPSLLKKVAMTIVAIPFCDSDDPEMIFYDDRFTDKQLMLISLLKEDRNRYASLFDFEASLLFAIKLNEDLCMDLLEFIGNICIKRKDYFNFNAFKKCFPHFYYATKNERFWNFMFMLLMNKTADMIEGYLQYQLARPNIFPYMFELLTGIIPFEFQDGINEGLSFRVLHTLYSIAIVQQLNLNNMIGSISNLCSLGFGDKSPFPYPFNITKSSSKTRRTSRPHVFRFSGGNEGNDQEKRKFGPDHLEFMDPDLYLLMDKHMSKHPISLDHFTNLFIPEFKIDPEKIDFEKLFSSNVATFASLLAAKCFIEVGNEASLFKKLFGPLLIYGADVYPKEAVGMHRKVVFAVLDERSKLSNDCVFSLIEFLTNRIVEGWWDGAIFDLFSRVILNVNATHKSLIPFIIACMTKNSKNSKELISMATLLMNTNLIFKYCIDNKNFINSFIAISTKPEVLSETVSFVPLLSDKLGNHDFSVAAKSFSIANYLEANPHIQATYNDFQKQIDSAAATNSVIVMNERSDNSRKQLGQVLFSFERLNIIQITYLRRAFRYEFFLRVNKGITVLEPSVTSMFRASLLLNFCKNPPEKHSINTNSHPLSVPNKQVPLLYPYDFKYEKVESLFNVPESEFKNDIKAVAPELNAIHFAPKCLEGWYLPGHYTAGVTMLFQKIFNGVIEPFSLNMILAPDPLKCVGILSNDSLHVLMNATMYSFYNKNAGKQEHEIHLLEKKMVGHYPIFENAIQGLMGRSSLFVGHVVLSIPFNLVNIVLPRKYCYDPSAVDIYTADGCHYTFVIKDTNVLKSLLSKISTHKNTTTRRGPGYSQRLLSRSLESVAKFWEHGIISNFDYLMFLNALSGRSFNDFSQYPVFPWIISDFVSKEGPKTYRDLSLPMGQLNHERAKAYDLMFKESQPPHYFYGTHYSYPGSVLYYLMRIEPITLYNVVLHKGFDQSDRVFLSFDETWKSSSEENQADVKELIPEFYSSPTVLLNINKNVYPHRTNGTHIEEVILPPWAKNDPSLFIYKMRKALESKEVTKKLPKWIDLIFGYKQRGDEAIKAKNVFTPQSYDDYKIEDRVEEKKNVKKSSSSSCEFFDEGSNELSPDEIFINNFGQCPAKLFNNPHPNQATTHREGIIGAKLNITKIRDFDKNMKSIRLFDDEIYATSDLNHYVGLHPKLTRIQEGAINIDGKYQFCEPVFDVTSSNISSDSLYLTITTRCGMVVNYFFDGNLFVLISESSIPGTHFLSCAISSHFSIVLANSADCVYMFDLTSGFLLRIYETKTPIKLTKFCETNDFIVLCEENLIHVLDTHFSVYNTINVEDKVTSLSVCDSVLWFEKTPFVTGHESGTVNVWTLDMEAIDEEVDENRKESKILRKKVQMFTLAKPFEKPIVAIEQIHDYTDVVCINEDGEACVISNKICHKRVLRASEFVNCCLCGEKLVQPSSVICTICGLAFCLNCSEPGYSAPICKNCLKAHKEEEAMTPSISQGEAIISHQETK